MNNEYIIYHNPNCSKSRKALELLEKNNRKPIIKDYLKSGLNLSELSILRSKLDLPARELIREKENILTELKVDLSVEEEVLKAIATHPILLERPIIVFGDKAIIARPPEKILSFPK